MSLPKPFYDADGITIYNADCREVLPLIAADVLVTDPPYGADNSSGWNGLHGECKITNDESTALRDAILAAWNGPSIVFGSWRMPRPAGTKAVLIWDKGGHSGMGDLSFPWKPNFEEIYVLGGGYAGRRTSSVLAHYIHPQFNATRTHPTEKPLSLMIELVSKCPEGTILDPFMGSGTTLVAAKLRGLKAVGIEINEDYCKIAVERLRQGVLIAV